MDPDSLPNGGPAFPCDPFIASEPGHVSVAKRLADGMTLRDYFAAKAVQAQLTAFWALETHHGWSHDEIAREAYAMADAMLRAKATS